METVLPPAALVLAIGAFFFQAKEEKRERPWGALAAAGPLVLLLLALAYWQGDARSNAVPAALAAMAGVVGAAVASLGTGRALPCAVAVALASLCHYLPVDVRPVAQLGLVVGMCLGGFATIGAGASIGAVSVAAVVAADWLGGRLSADHTPWAGVALGFLVVLALLVKELVPVGENRKAAPLAGALVLLGFGAWLVANRFLFLSQSWTLFSAGLVVALAVAWMLTEDDEGSFRPLLAAVVWVGLATVSFSLMKGFGMSLSLLGATAGCLLLGHRKALLTLGPLLALTFYRIFREWHPEASRAFDIGQHYAMIGVLIGAVLLLLPIEWERAFPRVRRVDFARFIWLVLVLCVPVAGALILGPKGAVGLLVGLGLSASAASVGRVADLRVLSLLAAVAPFMALMFNWMRPWLDMTRDEKVRAMIYVTVAVAALVAVLAALSVRRGPEVEAAEVAS